MTVIMIKCWYNDYNDDDDVITAVMLVIVRVNIVVAGRDAAGIFLLRESRVFVIRKEQRLILFRVWLDLKANVDEVSVGASGRL